MGLDVTLIHGTKQQSEKYPDHHCNPSYLRSSYNPGGFNSVASFLIGKDLYYIFEPADEYPWVPTVAQLQAARTRAEEVLLELQDAPPLGVIELSATRFGAPADQEVCPVTGAEAIAITNKEIFTKEKNLPFGGTSWSDGDGYFFAEGIAVVGAVPGMNFVGKPAVHLVYLREDMEYYTQLAEIIMEFIDHALELNNREISWSS